MFNDEHTISSRQKNRILNDWRRFIRGGFRLSDFSSDLYQFLTLHCNFIAHHDRQRFWEEYFLIRVSSLVVFMNQFGGDKTAAESRWINWLSGAGADLKEAMCQEAEQIFPPFERITALYILEKYEEEKWTDIESRLKSLPLKQQQAATASHFNLIFELLMPLECYPELIGVSDDLRQRLDFTVAVWSGEPEPDEGLDAIPWAETTETSQTANTVPLFSEAENTALQGEILGLNESAIDLSDRIAALTTEERSAPETVIIEGQQTKQKHLSL